MIESNSFDYLPQRCEHPVRIPDRSKPGHFLYVPCGHCKACLTNRRNSWQSKLYAEAKISAAVMFFTLTYDNKHLPVVRVVNDTSVLYKHRLINFKATNYDVNSFHPITSYADRQAFAVCSKKDVQNFSNVSGAGFPTILRTFFLAYRSLIGRFVTLLCRNMVLKRTGHTTTDYFSLIPFQLSAQPHAISMTLGNSVLHATLTVPASPAMLRVMSLNMSVSQAVYLLYLLIRPSRRSTFFTSSLARFSLI